MDESKHCEMDKDPPKSSARFEQLPNELFPYITKYLEDEDCVALALTGSLKGFAAFFSQNRW